ANFVSNQFNSGINFFNISTGTYSGTVFNWSFGDNTFSTTTSPAHTYSASGIYTVQLFAYNPAFSASCSSVYSTTVSVCTLSVNAVSQPSPGVFNFTATAAPNPTNANYRWNFGNGNTNQGTNLTSVSNSYSNAGIYTVTCYLSNPANSCSVTASTTVNASCSLLAGFNYTTGANGQVTFVSSSTGTNGSTTYTWNFGDGSPTATGSAVSHTYLANGTYTVSLFANSGGGCSSFTTIPIAIVNSNTCAASFTYNNLGGNSISFTSTSSGVNGSTTYSWNFGNGTTYSTTGTPTAVCNYTAPGNYVVILSINTPSNGCNTTFSQVVTVSSGPCNLLAGFVTNTLAPNSFSFINVSTGTLSSTSYTWDFGDGGFSFGQNASHSYIASGQYTVHLYASNNNTLTPCLSDTSMVVNSSFNCTMSANFSHTVGSGGPVTF
ncbi:MAG: PKD domain-containing protein, partial [Candidatus Kapabacteria bacterium]|nr:PKD domain-containing protein [Candidatus Kapabacteria bacterium]